MAVFMGNYGERKLDCGRIYLPERLRKILKESGISTLYLSAQKIENFTYVRASPELEENAIPVEIKGRRMKLPKEMRELIGLRGDEKCRLIGFFSEVQIWNAEHIRDYVGPGFTDEELKELAKKLGI